VVTSGEYKTVSRVHILKHPNIRLVKLNSLNEKAGTADGGTVVKVLCYKSDSIPDGVMVSSFRSHYGPGVDSASNRNEYQEHFLWVKAAGAKG
jgi:hypothetical protein